MSEKKDPGIAIDAHVAKAQEKAAESGSQATGDANDGGFVQVEGHGFTKEQLADRAAAEKAAGSDEKPHAPVKEDKLVLAMDAHVEAGQLKGEVLKTKGAHEDASIPLLKHPDSITERPADPPAKLAAQTGSLTNFAITPLEDDKAADAAVKSKAAANKQPEERAPRRSPAKKAPAKKPAATSHTNVLTSAPSTVMTTGTQSTWSGTSTIELQQKPDK